MDIKYVSGTGAVTIDFTEYPYIMRTGGTLIDYGWSFESTDNYQKPGGRITRFTRSITTRSIPIDVRAASEAIYIAAVNYLHNIFERDVVNLTPGKLYFNDYYLTCYVTSSTKGEWEGPADYQQNNLTITIAYPLWVKETTNSFVGSAGSGGLAYPYDYPYDYVNSYATDNLTNDHFASSDCEIIIYGACADPSIIIGGNTYAVTAELSALEYLAINTRDKTIYKYSSTGAQTNLFNSRNRSSYCFNQVPAGANLVSWDGSFAFRVTLFAERSEPEWT